MKYPKLFEPFKIGGCEIKNRIVMCPMYGMGMAGTSGEMRDQMVDYYVTRAKGGTGLIYTGVTISTIFPAPYQAGTLNILNNTAQFMQNATLLTDRVHNYGTKIFFQAGFGTGRNGDAGNKTPSAIPNWKNPKHVHEELSVQEIKGMIQQMVKAAMVAKMCGFDGVDIHALHQGYLLDEFAMSFMNHRTDEYGGSLENRLRPCTEIVQGIKYACGKDFPVTIRLGAKSFMKGYNQVSLNGEDEVGRTPEEAVEIAKILEKAGYDAIMVDSGTDDSFYYIHPPMYQPEGMNVPYAEMIKKAVSIPVIVSGRMNSPEICEQVLVEGKADAVGMGRPLLADPDFAKKAMLDRPEEIRPCLACHEGCAGRLYQGQPFCCAVNPQVMRENTYGLESAMEKKKVLVVGGGIAGMEAARVLKLRGHDVTLVEKSDRLGGNMLPAGAPDFKVDDRRLVAWYELQMKNLKIDVRMNTAMSADEILAFGADSVILAMGATPVMPKFIKGIDHEKAISSVDALMGKRKLGENIAVIGGGLVGCEVALDLANKGKKVTVVEMMPRLMASGKPVPPMNSMMMGDLLVDRKVDIRTGWSILEVNDDGAVIQNVETKETETISADDVIIAIGFQSVKDLAKELQGKIDLYEIGDGRQFSNVMNAVWDAYEVARSL